MSTAVASAVTSRGSGTAATGCMSDPRSRSVSGRTSASSGNESSWKAALRPLHIRSMNPPLSGGIARSRAQPVEHTAHGVQGVVGLAVERRRSSYLSGGGIKHQLPHGAVLDGAPRAPPVTPPVLREGVDNVQTSTALIHCVGRAECSVGGVAVVGSYGDAKDASALLDSDADLAMS